MHTDHDKFMEVIKNNNIDLVKEYIKAGADVHCKDDWALRWACRHGHPEVVKLLLEAGADVHADEYALRLASIGGHTEVVKLLHEAGADAHADDDYALRCASCNGHTEVVKVLLEAGDDVHACDDHALRWASSNGHTEVVKLLLEAGADVHACDDHALQWASSNGHTETVKLLEKYIDNQKTHKEPEDEFKVLVIYERDGDMEEFKDVKAARNWIKDEKRSIGTYNIFKIFSTVEVKDVRTLSEEKNKPFRRI